MQQIIVVLIGPKESGKTTLARLLDLHNCSVIPVDVRPSGPRTFEFEWTLKRIRQHAMIVLCIEDDLAVNVDAVLEKLALPEAKVFRWYLARNPQPQTTHA